MSDLSLYFRERFIVAKTKALGLYGISLQTGYDFEEYREILAEARPDHKIGAPFDPDRHDLGNGRALWLVARADEGRVIHTQALRLVELSDHTLSDFLRREFRGFAPSGVELDWNRCNYRPGPGAMRMRGRIAYHGEFWIGGNPGEFRGTGLTGMFSRCGYWEAMEHWNPDHIFAFMAGPVAYKGLAERAGWMHTEPGALRWFPAGGVKPIEGFMAYLHRYDVEYLLNITSADQFQQAA